MLNAPLEAHTRTKIDMRLRNLGWILEQEDKNCNVFQEQPKTDEQKKKLKGLNPDYVLYEKGSDYIIGIIEAKRPGENLDKAIEYGQKSIDICNKYDMSERECKTLLVMLNIYKKQKNQEKYQGIKRIRKELGCK